MYMCYSTSVLLLKWSSIDRGGDLVIATVVNVIVIVFVVVFVVVVAVVMVF